MTETKARTWRQINIRVEEEFYQDVLLPAAFNKEDSGSVANMLRRDVRRKYRVKDAPKKVRRKK